DPWPKKRHHKRRLIDAAFLDAALRVLAVGGRLSIQTDHAEYFEVIRSLTNRHPLLAPVPFEDADFATADGGIQTNYEIKYLRAGRSIHRLAFIRREFPSHEMERM